MLQMNVSQLLKEPVGSTRSYEVSGTAVIASEVQGGIMLTRTNRGILVRAELKTEMKTTCSRCLSLFNYPLTMTIEEEYFPVIDVNTGSTLSLPDEPGGFTIDEHHILDLTEAIRQYALLAIPMKPLCRENCAGICSRCGRNLNLGDCACPTGEVDPRWAKLNELVLTGDISLNGKEGKK